ncbi:SDR family NAD(P)-dependent oxidoreductase [Mycolicibacterium confluentis]|uniref:3-oxoacyl-[acyl-carrier-protein] reductase MabA n=1 Tax=Mycolicibacterium confluentis TaxID=28047 RepID=A0A7I7Y3T1_9MYCO|nr:SDR family oxidoreductase [Mycolicibacterium confluentis]MCV7322768.1 SDR family oxidoreductase [Mycolicibacterium confluentis]ORV29708.1 short-chain dehydrogenase [Mycolicibacterium confluentis]BBZ36327.1 short-chain dehydrogenase [Mycolicibacterium confluentis]
MNNALRGRTALVTGATAGIGYAIARQLAAAGAAVTVHGRNAERGAKAVQDIENDGGRALFVAADLADVEDVRRLAEEVGDVDILVNNAGVYRFAGTLETTDADFDEQINTNLRAPYLLVQELVPGMLERGDGIVINVTTVAASTPAAEAGIYGAGKAGLELLTKLWADEFGARGVRVNAVAPGPTQTEGTAALGDQLIEGLGRTTALGRTATADEIANVVTFLASPAASYVNGAILAIGGGSLAIRPAA